MAWGTIVYSLVTMVVGADLSLKEVDNGVYFKHKAV